MGGRGRAHPRGGWTSTAGPTGAARSSGTPARDELDTSILLHAGSGFDVGARMSSTMDALRAELGAGPLLYRYSGRGEGGGGVRRVSFWAVSALHACGRTDEARALMDELVPLANDVGVLAEMIDPADGTFLGNLPQGLSHLALIGAALDLEQEPEAARQAERRVTRDPLPSRYRSLRRRSQDALGRGDGVGSAPPSGPAADEPAQGQQPAPGRAVPREGLHRVLGTGRGEPADRRSARADLPLVHADRPDDRSATVPPLGPGAVQQHRGQLRARQQREDEAVAVQALADAAAGLEQAGVAQARPAGGGPVVPAGWAPPAVARVVRVVGVVLVVGVVPPSPEPGHAPECPTASALTLRA